MTYHLHTLSHIFGNLYSNEQHQIVMNFVKVRVFYFITSFARIRCFDNLGRGVVVVIIFHQSFDLKFINYLLPHWGIYKNLLSSMRLVLLFQSELQLWGFFFNQVALTDVMILVDTERAFVLSMQLLKLLPQLHLLIYWSHTDFDQRSACFITESLYLDYFSDQEFQIFKAKLILTGESF